MEENQYINLVLKHLDRQASPEEEARLQQWLEADPSHREEYLALEKVWLDNSAGLTNRQFDADAAWDKVLPRLRQTPSTPLPQPSYHISARRLVAAASILICLAVGGWWFLSHPRQQPDHLVTADKDNFLVTLPDGSSANLRKGASLKFPASFVDSKREVTLQGSGFFRPFHDPQKPFIIITSSAILEDIGTAFFVEGTGMEGDVMVTEGKVKWIDRTDHNHETLLVAGQKAEWKDHQLMLSATKTPNFMSWMTGVLAFQDIPLEEAMKDINNYYHAKLSIAPALRSEAGSVTVTARFDHQPLREVLEEIKLATGLKTIQVKDSLYFVRK